MIRRIDPTTPATSMAMYAPIISQNTNHFVSRISARRTGFDAKVCMTPEAISPDSASTGSMIATATASRFTA
ncbi:MAG: hypothetical protein WDM77_10440 [Steroidobacteraceae bacterium]